MNDYSFLDMPEEVRNRLIPVYARRFAAEKYRLAHPGCSGEAAWSHAVGHWREHVMDVITWMAIQTALEESNRAAPWN